MKKNLVIKSSLLIVLGLVIVVGLTGCSSNIKVESEDKDGSLDIKNTIIENTTKSVDKKTINYNSEKSKEEIVKELYKNYIEERAKQYKSELSDYTIDEVDLEDVPNIKLMYPESKDGDFLARVIYSVKPAVKLEESNWYAGNGELDDEWIKHKSACLIITKNDGNYSIAGNGTGW